MVFVKNEIMRFVKQINVSCKFAIFLVLSTMYTGYDKDMLLIVTYLPPKGSTFYRDYKIDNGVELLQEELLNLSIANDCYYTICGDLNARCGGLDDYVIQDGIEYVDEDADWYDTDEFSLSR